MKHAFVPYELSKELNELGFNEPCLAFYVETKELVFASHSKEDQLYPNNSELLSDWISAPLFSQVFKWFREKYNFHGECYPVDLPIPHYDYRIIQTSIPIYFVIHSSVRDQQRYISYEEAELECLRKLIEIAKKWKN